MRTPTGHAGAGTLRKLAAMLTMLVAIGGVFAATASPADAASACHTNDRRFSVPGEDLNVHVQLCVGTGIINGVESVHATARVSWDRSVPNIVNSFDFFSVTVRLERADRVIRDNECEVHQRIGGSARGAAPVCSTSWVEKGAARTWTADGIVTYDINNDGKGRFTWDLTGSPAL
jgi:hypothetical protein